MFVLGLTGSIGMGKSVTARMFADAGVPVYEADTMVHLLYDGELAPEIEAAFPGTTRDGRVDRAILATRVLGDPDALRRLEAIVHPRVREQEQRFLAKAQSDGATVAVLDIPLLLETGGGERVDAVVVVSAPPDMQRNRVLEREGMSAKKFEAILAQQMPDEEKRRRADFVVDTSKGFSAAREQVRAILDSVAKMPQRRH